MSSFVIKYLPVINVLLNTHTIHVPKLTASCAVLYQSNFVCLFVIFRPTWEFFTHMETSPLPMKGCKFCLAPVAIEQWGFFSVPHLLWQGASVKNGHLWGPVTLTPIVERLAVELSLPVFTTWICRGWNSNTHPSPCNFVCKHTEAKRETYIKSWAQVSIFTFHLKC